jgi:predicted TIM-barrel fold metal-dependent hydrolase
MEPSPAESNSPSAGRPVPFPAEIVECHHHFLDPDNNSFQGFLKSLGASEYLPEAFEDDARGLPITKTVHVEALPDDGHAEARWVAKLVESGRAPRVAAIVGQVDPSAHDAGAQLDELRAISPAMRGIRYILDYDGDFDGGKSNATHAAASRHGKDYLRDPTHAADFERGIALLAERSLTFDLQCCPAQLPAAAEIFARHPDLPVCIDHLGKPRHLAADGSEADEAELAKWRAGMKQMAALPNVHVKLSMLGYAVPGWHKDPAKEELVRSLVRETIALFGARRCMFSGNWHINAAVSNSDGVEEDGPAMPELYERFAGWVADVSAEERAALFAETAKRFYGIQYS